MQSLFSGLDRSPSSSPLLFERFSPANRESFANSPVIFEDYLCSPSYLDGYFDFLSMDKPSLVLKDIEGILSKVIQSQLLVLFLKKIDSIKRTEIKAQIEIQCLSFQDTDHAIFKFKELIRTLFQHTHINASNQTKLIRYFAEKFITNNKDAIESDVPKLALEEHQVQLFTQIVRSLNEQFSPIDNRRFFRVDRKQRRLDSLSKLLSPDGQYTACIALSVFQGEFIISSNNYGTTSSGVPEILLNKLELIREFVTRFTFNDVYKSQFDELTLEELSILVSNDQSSHINEQLFLKTLEPDFFEACTMLIESLKLNGGLFQNRQILYQAIIKILFANPETEFPETDCFNPDEYKLIFSREKNPTILMTAIDDASQNYGLNIWSDTKTMPMFIHFEPQYDAMEIELKHFHAEQLITYYLIQAKQLKTFDTPLRIGLPKLCCESCAPVMRFFNAIVTGSSGTEISGTVQLLPERTFKSPDASCKKRAAHDENGPFYKEHSVPQITQKAPSVNHSPASPLITPLKIRRISSVSALGVGARSALFLADEVESPQAFSDRASFLL